MLTKIQRKRNTIKRERNIKRRKEIALKYRKSEAWRKSAKGRAVQAERQREELAVIAAATLPTIAEQYKQAGVIAKPPEWVDTK